VEKKIKLVHYLVREEVRTTKLLESANQGMTGVGTCKKKYGSITKGYGISSPVRAVGGHLSGLLYFLETGGVSGADIGNTREPEDL